MEQKPPRYLLLFLIPTALFFASQLYVLKRISLAGFLPPLFILQLILILALVFTKTSNLYVKQGFIWAGIIYLITLVIGGALYLLSNKNSLEGLSAGIGASWILFVGSILAAAIAVIFLTLGFFKRNSTNN